VLRRERRAAGPLGHGGIQRPAAYLLMQDPGGHHADRHWAGTSTQGIERPTRTNVAGGCTTPVTSTPRLRFDRKRGFTEVDTSAVRRQRGIDLHQRVLLGGPSIASRLHRRRAGLGYR
jgi:hypothetical protein